MTIDGKIKIQALALIAGHPYTVNEALIIGVHRKGVFTCLQVVGNIDLVIVIGAWIAGRRSLRNEGSVDVKFVIVISGDLEDSVFGCGQVDFLPK